MKRALICLLTVLVLTMVLCMAVSAAEDNHPHEGTHCVCGGAAVGVGDHTQCEAIEWIPLSGALKAAGLTMSTADFGKLPSGNYYLDGDVTVTEASSLGNKSDSLATVADRTVSLRICLNGFDITRSGSGKVFGYMHMGSMLSICDCSYENGSFGGTVTGGSNSYGSVIYTYSRSTLNIYGGNFVGHGYAGGGSIVVASDGCGDVNGDRKYTEADRLLAPASVMNLYNGHITGSVVSQSGGTIQLFHTASMNLYGGTIVGGTAGTTGGAIATTVTCTVTVAGGTVVGGTCAKGTELVQVIGYDGKLLGTYTTFDEGLAKAENATDCYLRLINDVTAADTVSGTLYLDLNGYTLQGITITGTLYGMDSTTNSYDDANAGKLTPVFGAPEKYVKTAQTQTGAVRRYLAVESAGSYSFHRFYLGITKVSMKPDTYGVGYKAYFAGDETVSAALNSGMAFGYKLWLREDAVINRGYDSTCFDNKQELTLRVDNFLDPALTAAENAERAEKAVHAVAYLRFADGTEITSAEVCYDLRQIMELADDAYAGFNTAQKSAIESLSAEFSAIMLGWDIENTHHTDGSIWEAVNAAGFEKKLTLRSGNTYNLAGGNYVLTEDINLGTKRMRVNGGTTVSICLNGHTITGNNRLIEQYGTLNICDCHDNDSEGVMISTQAGQTATYASVAYCRYSSVTNIYGGHLRATGKVTSAGVLAVSHDGSDKTKPAAILNIYGGSISGGQTYEGGGLICIWNNGEVNVYGGELYDGSADTRGGAINLVNGKLNIYGGQIYDNSAETGGAICAVEELVIAGGEITGNTAGELGGGIYLTGCTAILSGAPRITGNAGSDLFLEYNATVSADGLTEGADVCITPNAMTVLGTNEQVIPYLTCRGDGYSVQKVYDKVVVWADGVEPVSPVDGFQVGFGESNITPETIDGMPLQGYGNDKERLAVDKGRQEYDDLMAQSVAITDENGTTVILIYADLITCNARVFDYVVDSVAAATGVPEEHIFLNFSHSHSVPSVTTSMPIVVEYNRTLPDLFARSALQAMNDRQPATMETGSFEVQNTINGKTQYYNFYRHYSYEEDGIVKYFGDQFGTATYNSTTAHIRDADHTMHLVRFIRDGKDILISNWRIHPHFTGGESKYLLSADAIGTIRYYMAQKLPDTHYVYFQGAAGNVNEESRLNSSRVQESQVQSHGLDYVAYGEVIAQCIVDNLGCLQSEETGLLQVDHYDYLAKADNPTDEQYANAKKLYDIFVVETAGMTLGQQNTWVRNYCAEHPEYNYVSAFQLSFIVNRRYNQQDTVLPLNVVTLGKSFALFTAPFELWDSISMEVEEKSPFKTTFCLGYSMDHQHYMVYYPEYLDQQDGVPYISYESENRHFKAPDTVQDMISYWVDTLNKLYNN